MVDAVRKSAKYASKHSLLGKEAQPIHIVINMTVVVRNNFWLFIQYNQMKMLACFFVSEANQNG